MAPSTPSKTELTYGTKIETPSTEAKREVAETKQAAKKRATRQEEAAKQEEELFNAQIEREQNRVTDNQTTQTREDSPNDLRVSGKVLKTTPRTRR